MSYLSPYVSTNGAMPYGQGMTSIPGANDDWNGTSGSGAWCDGALWQYVAGNGAITMYICLTSSPGAAQWKAL